MTRRSSRRGLTIVELLLASAILTTALLATVECLLRARAATATSTETGIAEHGAELMLDLIRSDADGSSDLTNVYRAYGGGSTSGVLFGDDPRVTDWSDVSCAQRFGFTDALTNRPRLRSCKGYLFVGNEVDVKQDPPRLAAAQLPSETLYAGAGAYGVTAGLDLNGNGSDGKAIAWDDNARLTASSRFSSDILPVVIVVRWESTAAPGEPALRTFQLRSCMSRSF